MKTLKFGIIGALSITLLIGCTSNSNETKASNKEASTAVKEKEIVYENVMFEQKEVRKLEISRVNSKGVYNVINNENIKTIFTSMESAEKKTLLLDQEAKNYIHSKMKVTYQDNSIQEFFVWIESDGDIVIAKASDETHGEGYDLREDNSKKIIQFFEKEF
ncbi:MULTISPECIES: hypothetical protein [Bacillus cereus group]|uniref:hypothetical protein n=2 Tax=Bacillaceae TaxID=186817 RepID=UPI000304A745|nr:MULTISPECIES: hypothetical protein [Bacillus cereus group]MCU4921149.1 hypothetical protein [Bacillus cereus]MEB9629067.1 hypothetical protein [Bacillus anthracis]OUA97227.1 hypothetical protein BK714_19010 [Bacillus thuringiensis serovar oswaldocruzi]QKE08165.1 hypothetical protein HPG46_15205 [Bacillus cereus]TXR66474.1 hypothetical protein DN395_06665 [Bacillus sp. AR18-7]